MCKDLNDIILKKGDVVFYLIENDIYSTAIDIVELQKDILDHQNIVKIERPTKYETIYETPKEILTKKEKEYLENMLRPFKDRVKTIMKVSSFKYNEEFIYIFLNTGFIHMPEFSKGTMYKGMQVNKGYTIEELELFKG